jgi:hypothetical protein
MKRNLSRLLKTVAVVFSTIIVSAILPVTLTHAQGQLPPDAPLADQLKAQYKVTKFGLDGGGFTVLSPGTILVIQEGGILGVPPANLTMGVAIFKDGDLKQPSAGNRMFLGNITRFLQVGEKVYVQKVDVNLKNDKVQLTVVECDAALRHDLTKHACLRKALIEGSYVYTCILALLSRHRSFAFDPSTKVNQETPGGR